MNVFAAFASYLFIDAFALLIGNFTNEKHAKRAALVAEKLN
jgi:hypothetical protein